MVRHRSIDGMNIVKTIDPDYLFLQEIEQGFITNRSRFVSREEALKIAEKNNQIKYDIGYKTSILFSEMLY